MIKPTEIKRDHITLPSRKSVRHKGDAGKLLIIGGEVGMAGAPYFSAESAYRSGAGLVRICTSEGNREILQILIPEAVLSFWSSFNFSDLNSYNAVAVGMGMGQSDRAVAILERVMTRGKTPILIDADALNIISQNRDLLSLCGENTILTPHVLEFSRLTGKSPNEVLSDPVGAAADFSNTYRTNVILKDSVSVIATADGDTYINRTGSSALSKGGSGDILSGFISSLIAQGLGIKDAAVTATYLFGKAGEMAGERLGERGALARDVIGFIPEILKGHE